MTYRKNEKFDAVLLKNIDISNLKNELKKIKYRTFEIIDTQVIWYNENTSKGDILVWVKVIGNLLK